MAVPVTVPRLGPGEGEALIAEWYQPDGATVAQGDLVYRIETDFAAIDIEADEAGIVRHATSAGTASPFGEVVAYILSPGEPFPGEVAVPEVVEEEAPAADEQPGAASAEATEPAPPAPADVVEPEESELPAAEVAEPATDRAGAYPLADVLRATAAAEGGPASADALPGLPWDPFPGSEAAESGDSFEMPKPVLLFPRIVNEIKEEAAVAQEDEDVLEAMADVEEDDAPAEPASAWDLVPGESDFNPEWLLEPSGKSALTEAPPEARSRFQASNIRSLALGRARDAEKVEAQPDDEHEPPAAERPDPKSVIVEPVPSGSAQVAASEAAVALPDLDNVKDRRGDYAPGAPLFMRVAVDVTEATKMREQLTREWWGSNIRPTDHDVVLRAIARALHESAAFRRRTDVVGLRPLAGSSRAVHLLGDAATRPFRDAVASLAALRETPGAEMACLCTLTDLSDLALDDAVAALPGGQPLAFAMGCVRDVARFDGDRPRRASELVLTLSYDSDAMPEGAAARLLSRVRELVEAPYALLAD
jgi:pyruvate/2-oxoglutarate dehydrogenase complex dihydrolipoamide acyltransferase (E2) component